MNIVFISPHFPSNFINFCSALADAGATVLGIGDVPAGQLSPELRSVLADYLYIPDMLHRESMTRALGLLTYRHGKIDRIDSLNEHWLGIEADLRRDFNVFGLKPSDLSRARDKGGMHKVFTEAGIPCARWIRVSSPKRLRAFIDEVGLPIVLKPRIGVGAARTFKVKSFEELDEFWPRLDQRTIAEEYLNGRLMSFDGLCDREGRILFEHCTEVNMGVLEIVQSRGDIHYYSLREPPQSLLDIGRKIVAAFEIRERFFHVEVFLLPDGSCRALEINMRPPGGFSTDMMNYSNDMDVYRLWAQVVTRGTIPDFSAERKYHCAHVGRRSHRRYRLDHPTLVARLGPSLMMFRELPKAIGTVMGDIVYFIRNASFDALKSDIELIEAKESAG